VRVPSAKDTREQVARETERRERLGVPALVGGVFYLLSGIIIDTTLKGGPTVGLLQGLEPALSGVASPAVSPRAAEVKFASHHAFGLIAGSVVAALSIGALTLILLVLLAAIRFRRPQTWTGTQPLVIAGGIALAVVSVGHQVVLAIETHRFAVGHVYSNHAVEHALENGTAIVITQYLALLATFPLAAGMIMVTLNGLRTGLLPRWMGILGMFTGVLIILPTAPELDVVPAFWMVMIGILFVGKWPNGEPPAWAAGEARPWPSRARMRGGPAAGQPALSMAGADVTPAPAQPATKSSSRKRRRKRGARG
jgi:hypothetical protein